MRGLVVGDCERSDCMRSDVGDQIVEDLKD